MAAQPNSANEMHLCDHSILYSDGFLHAHARIIITHSANNVDPLTPDQKSGGLLEGEVLSLYSRDVKGEVEKPSLTHNFTSNH